MQRKLTEQGLRYLEEGQFEKASQILSLLINSFPDNADAHHMLGIIKLERGDFEAAYVLVNTAIDIVQDNPMFYNTLGNIELHRKRIAQAETAFLTAIKLNPGKIEYKYNLAHFYLTQNQYTQAIDYYYNILHTHPTHYLSIRGITVCYLFAGELDIALEHADAWVEEFSEYDEAYYYQGLCRYALGDIAGALSSYDKGLDLAPTNQDIITAIGACYRNLGNFSIAETYLHKSLSLGSNNSAAIYHLANIKLDQGEVDAARELFNNAINLDPSYIDPVCGLGEIELSLNNPELALTYFLQAHAIDTANLKTKSLVATTLLRLQRFAQGWPAYSKCISLPSALKAVPAWNGEKLSPTQTLLIWTPSSNNDLSHDLLFYSMLHDLTADVPRALVVCKPRLVSLLQQSFPQYTFSSDLAISDIDAQLPLNLLGIYYRATIQAFIRNKRKFLQSNLPRTAYYRSKYQSMFPGQKLVGIAWKAQTNSNAIDYLKSSHLSSWQPLLRKSGYQFISLQTGEFSAEIDSVNRSSGRAIYVDPDANLQSKVELADLSAQLAAMDLVISVDSNIAHLAGGLGLPVYTLLPLRAEWYWFADSDQSLWYPNMRLFRQTVAQDWAAPLHQLLAAL